MNCGGIFHLAVHLCKGRLDNSSTVLKIKILIISNRIKMHQTFLKKTIQRLLTAGICSGGFLFCNAQVITPTSYPSAIKVNYIRTWDATAPEQSTATLKTRNVTDVKQSTQYFDGLGRPIETVMKQTSPLQKDMVTAAVYDAFGREQYKYLPFASTTTSVGTEITNDGNFKLNPFQQDSVFSKAQYTGETYYYGQTVFEASPLNRAIQSFAPGNSWVGSKGTGTERAIGNQYLLNTVADSVRIWNILAAAGSLPTSTAIYSAGLLYENVTKDEHGKQVVEFKDKEGKVILKKVQLSNTPGTAHAGWLCTYYVYDELNNLRFVIQPRGTELIWSNWTITTVIANELCFRYEYDQRNRMIIKKIPGAGEVWMVYDARDRLVMAQDSVQRLAGKWIVTEYDAQNRPLRTNLWTNSSNRSTHQTAAYNSAAYPIISGTNEVLTENFYDNYNWVAGSGTTLTNTINTANTSNSTYFNTTYNISPVYAQPITASYQTRGIATGSKIKVLGTASQYLYTVNFYDEKGRVIQIQSINITGGKDFSTTQYSWDGKAIRNYTEHQKSGTLPQNYTVLTKMDYDHAGRLLTIKKTFNGGTEKTIATNTYNELGQLKTKALGSSIETLTYDYNIRSWLLGVNRNYLTVQAQGGTNKFGFELAYDKATSQTAQNYTAALQYNGNIAGMAWKSDGDDVRRIYNFSYDNANRLLKGDFKQQNPDDNLWNNTQINYSVQMGDGTNANTAYDANGNILKMIQYGYKLGVAGTTPIDNLTYNYIAASNKLLNVIDANNDANTKLGDFRTSLLHPVQSKTTTTVDYTYDGNGNLKKDLNKDIGLSATDGIVYNHLNLPQTITVYKTGGVVKGTIAYTYDATGTKLKKITTEGAKITTTLYLGAFNYVNDSLQFVSHEEGRIRPKTIGNIANGFVYDYFLRDHLGNVRMVLTEEQQTDSYPAATMEAASTTTEEALYANLNTTRIAKPVSYPVDNTTNPNANVAKVTAAAGGQKVGPSITLKVMAGDKFNLKVSSWYKTSGATPGTPVSPLPDLLTALINGVSGASAGKTSITQLQSSAVLTPGATSFLSSQAVTAGRPKAYLNWILFDEQFKFVSSSSGFEQVPAETAFGTVPNQTVYQHVKSNLTIDKCGYLYVYVSNETPNIDVFFDNLQVTHVRGPVLEVNNFYPWGLRMEALSYRAAGKLENKYLFNKGSELQNKEFSDGSGLELYATPLRSLDPQLGRWWQIDSKPDYAQSLYSSMNNNPILYNDPLGDTLRGANNAIVSYSKDKDGNTVWKNATNDITRVGNLLLQNSVGAALLDKLISNDRNNTLTIDQNTTKKGIGADGKEGTILGETTPTVRTSTIRQGGKIISQTTKVIKESIVIYEKAITEAYNNSNKLSMTFHGRLTSILGNSLADVLGSVVAHEITHATDKNSQQTTNPNATLSEIEKKPVDNQASYLIENLQKHLQ